ncbi:hypothetical protein F0M03_04050 [Vibrio parahaemolyticus]|nr:hypothetical protein [Vibrio parahaemolyticus]QDG82512.1 hypothetical protein FKM99_02605 [Vibrio parahaemolyticus]
MQWMQFAGNLRITVIKYGCLVNIYVMEYGEY